MSITYVASASANTGASTSVTITKPTGTVDDDVMIAVFSNGQTDGTTPASTDWTNIDFNEVTAGTDGMSSIFYKVASSEGTNYTFDYPSSTSNQTVGIISTFRGVDASVLDETYVTGSHFLNEQDGGAAPTPQPINTNTANAFVVVTNFHQLAATTAIAPPSGYTEAAEVLVANRYSTMAYIDAGATGTQTPGSFTMTDATVATDHFMYTLALKPAGAGAAGSNQFMLMGLGT